MTQTSFAVLENRSVFTVSGPDAAEFLQGLVSNDVTKVSERRAIWAAFLTPQGKFLHEFMIAALGPDFVLDCERDRRDDLIRRLSRYRLRSNVEVSPRDDLSVATAWGDDAAESFGLDAEPGAALPKGSTAVFVDPRLAAAGLRMIGPARDLESLAQSAGCEAASPVAYDTHRLALGLPDGSRDMEVEKALLLENGFAELNGVDFDKGCYIGQELTARTHYRALIKKRLLPVTIEGDAPGPGTGLSVDGADAGEMKSSADNQGLALVRLATWQSTEDGVLTADAAKVTPSLPSWIKLQDRT